MERHYVTPSRGIALKFQGTIDLNELYRQMKLWLEDRGYAKEENLEKKYVERTKPNGKQIEILWEGNKSVSDYFKYKIRILFILLGINETEVQVDDVKRKLYKGSFQISIIGYVEEGSKEYDSLGAFTKLYRKLVARKRLQDHINGFYQTIYGFQEYIRKFLNIRT